MAVFRSYASLSEGMGLLCFQFVIRETDFNKNMIQAKTCGDYQHQKRDDQKQQLQSPFSVTGV